MSIHQKNNSSQTSKGISSLTYAESIRKLDQLLEKLQNDSIPIEEVQKYYEEGTSYLIHCEKLLKKVEQEVIELDI